MELYNLIASWAGWPVIVAVILVAGGYAGWLLNNRIEHLKETNESLRRKKSDKAEIANTGIKITYPRPDNNVIDNPFMASGYCKQTRE